MKNKFQFFFINITTIFFLLISNSYTETFEFEAENIETINNDFIKASNKIIVKNNLGITIYGEKLILDKKKQIYTITEDVVFEDKKNLLKIETQKIVYNVDKNIVKSYGLTNINKDDQYNIETSNITYNRLDQKIFSNDKTLIKDLRGNKLVIKELDISLREDLLVAQNAQLTDSELNIYDIEKLYYHLKEKKIAGKDLVINKDNTISINNYLPRVKSRSFNFKDKKLTMEKSVYTNCKKRDGCPPWSIQAEKIVHDQKEKTINYTNALLKFFDIPVLYFPKFFHPDPSVERRSGFLTPTFSANNSNSYFKIPYFFEIADNSDFTLSPRFYDNSETILQGEYRLMTKKTEHTFDASIKNDNINLLDDNDSRTHFFSNSKINTDLKYFDTSEMNIQLQSTSGNKYLKSYDITSPIVSSNTTLNSKINFQGSNDDLDFSISTEIYESLSKEKDSDKYEFILPNFNITKNIDTGLDGFLTLTNTGYNKLFNTNVNEKVLINDLSYKSLDTINNLGFISNFEILMKNFNADSENSSYLKNKTENDLQGIIQFNSKIPLKKEGYKYSSSLTPIFVGKFNPFKNKNISGFDRMIDYNNIYSINRIGTNETLEGDSSITIGNEFKIFNNSDQVNEIFSFNLASSFRSSENNDLPIKSSLSKKMSNITGQFNFKPQKFIDLSYDFLTDNNMDQINYHKIDSTFKVNNFVTSFEFIEENNDIGNESFIANETSLKIDANKNLKFKTRKNKKTDLTEYYNLIYQYKMDCLTAGIEYKKDYYNDGDLKPKESIFFSITLMPFGTPIDLPGVD